MTYIGEYDEPVRDLRKLIKENSELQNYGLDFTDDFLISYIRGKNGDLKNAYKTIQNYVNIRKGKYNDFFRSLVPSKCAHVKPVSKIMGFFKQRDDDGHVIGYFKLSALDLNVVAVDDVFRALIIAAEEFLVSQDLTAAGLVGIIDCRGMSFQHVKSFGPTRLQFLFNIIVGTYPIKYKGFHVLYDTIVFDPFLKVVKMFAPKKIRDRIFLHGSSIASLHKSFPTSTLPASLFQGELSDEECLDMEMEERAFSREEYYEKLALKW